MVALVAVGMVVVVVMMVVVFKSSRWGRSWDIDVKGEGGGGTYGESIGNLTKIGGNKKIEKKQDGRKKMGGNFEGKDHV